jgi:hypothetical protein
MSFGLVFLPVLMMSLSWTLDAYTESTCSSTLDNPICKLIISLDNCISPKMTFLNSGAKFFKVWMNRASALITYLDLWIFKATSRSMILPFFDWIPNTLVVLFVSLATLGAARELSSFMLFASERAWWVAYLDMGWSLSYNSVYV